MLIRLFEPLDADSLATLFHASVHEAGIRDYSAEQVWAWSPSKPDPQRYLQQAQDRTILVAIDNDGRPVGYGNLEPDGHMDHLYCRPDMIGVGVGLGICAAIETVARKAGIKLLFVEASEGARRLFERRGFILEARNEFAINGVMIHDYRMSKWIA
ncbi:GNAT family N-acetyltransferase [Sphingobium sp. AP49]|uniref:GNAT family N-acetyltransferase n=1 Tax=Sphingobium sp. AP49 TaxID=1144307 RepID=UPI00055DE4FD|nr:GNAT family N-acetyltransferase [Sphingobium sp. AP49]WHO37784.1 GNAT family N-acetyltransferase [Sphingobium sp. AP49]